ncbi:nuclear transport factor 2 family protein [Polaribacter sp. Z022]|uniref:nuclear transport factor 2 family protein n=1 Tax=Polaribacter sp. Z022 TaxID=2927125 RepID=UPI00202221F8|nr:nuclear transport factor 2 family protein [Polaribacter sp. Z022]MCL7752568.1 nuclear transport factor 2 family protein [Polaribacter sp. Z022]
MLRIITFVIAVIFSITISAQKKTEEKAIQSVIETFFKGLHNGDSAVIGSTLHKNIKIQTTFTNKKGVKVLKTESKAQLLQNIAKKKKEDIYLEKLLSYTIKIDGNLASVWTPYEFYFNGKFSHCGANSFQLFNNNGVWEIIYLVDMRRRAKCKAINQKK